MGPDWFISGFPVNLPLCEKCGLGDVGVLGEANAGNTFVEIFMAA